MPRVRRDLEWVPEPQLLLAACCSAIKLWPYTIHYHAHVRIFAQVPSRLPQRGGQLGLQVRARMVTALARCCMAPKSEGAHVHICRCLAPKPEDRPSARDLVHLLEGMSTL